MEKSSKDDKKILEEVKVAHSDDKHVEDSKTTSEHKFPSKAEIKDKSGKIYTVVGTKSCKKCHGSGLIPDSKDSKKEYTCAECNPTVCSHCLGSHWNFDKKKSCSHCKFDSDKPKDKASGFKKKTDDSKKDKKVVDTKGKKVEKSK